MHLTCTGIGFPAQHGFDFLRNDCTTENASERVTNGRLELAFDTVD